MRKARIADTGEIVIADDLLKFYPNYNEIIFVCLDEKCSVRMAPSCITKNSHRKPHFKKYRNQDHIETCEYAILNNLYHKGKDQKLNKTEINKVGYPSVFDLKDSNKEKVISKAKIDSCDEGRTGQVNETSILYEFDGENLKFDRSNKVQSIDRIVDWYLGFPHNRDVEIEIHNKKIPYRYFFKRIADYTDSVSLQKVQNERIFYGRIMLSKINQNVFNKDAEKVMFTLFGFKDKNEADNIINHYSVKIDKKFISRIMLSKLRNKYDAFFEKAFREFKNQSYDPNVGLYAFLYGTIDNENDTVLNVKQNHITFRYDEVRKTVSDD